jgi:hypothetical protein
VPTTPIPSVCLDDVVDIYRVLRLPMAQDGEQQIPEDDS